MLLVLVGKTASGKDSIRAELIKKYNMSPVVTYTTRPMRSGEVNGVSYHFVTNDVFNKMKDENAFAETTSYNVATGETWQYGTPYSELDDNKKVIILNPEGIKNMPDIDAFIVYVNAPTNVIKKRLKKRGDNKREARRRIRADKKDFKNIHKYVDFQVDNYNNMSAELSAHLIYELYRLKLFRRKNNESITQ